MSNNNRLTSSASDPAFRIRVDNLSKVYKVYWGPRSLVKEIFFRIPSHNPFHALQGVSFEVAAGEAFGLVGDNGAGKSTLLKLLCGTAYATAGSVNVQGSIAALLELGSGFHPEFTGRKNIYFSGALTGLSREEVREREAEIIEFSELEDFIDRPVKTYSSGMYLRLGFAVATGFKPDILMIDEALAVGDQGFQKKCTDRILQFKERGVTIVFCSHNLHQVKTLCDRALWLHKSRPMALGDAGAVVERYRSFCREDEASADARPLAGRESGVDRKMCRIEAVALRKEPAIFQTGDTVRLDITAYFGADFPGTPAVSVAIVRNDGIPVFVTATGIDRFELHPAGPQVYQVTAVFPDIALLAGRYYFNVAATDETNLQAYDVWERAASFEIDDPGTDWGLIRLDHFWETPLSTKD